MTYYTYLASFLCVYRTLSFSKAAKSLRLSQSSVTNHIQNLENKFNKTLFERHSRKVEPTPFAHQVANMVAPHIHELDNLLGIQTFSNLNQEITLYIGGQTEMLEFFVLPKLAPLVAQHYRFKINIGDSLPMVSDLENGRIDFLLGYQIYNQNIESLHIGDGKGCLYAGKKIATTFIETLKEGDCDKISRLPWIVQHDDFPFLKEYLHTQVGIDCSGLKPVIISKDYHSSIKGIINNLGAAIINEDISKALIDRGDIVKIHTPKKPIVHQIYLHYLKDKRDSPGFTNFIQHISKSS